MCYNYFFWTKTDRTPVPDPFPARPPAGGATRGRRVASAAYLSNNYSPGSAVCRRLVEVQGGPKAGNSELRRRIVPDRPASDRAADWPTISQTGRSAARKQIAIDQRIRSREHTGISDRIGAQGPQASQPDSARRPAARSPAVKSGEIGGPLTARAPDPASRFRLHIRQWCGRWKTVPSGRC